MSITSTFTLDKKTKKEWIKRLRSGKYKQTESVLYSPSEGAYCCLGVLCEIEGKSKEEITNKEFPHNAGVGECMSYYEVKFLIGSYPLYTVTSSPHFSGDDDELAYLVETKKHGWISLSALNDSLGYTFEEIADVVEKYVQTHAD